MKAKESNKDIVPQNAEKIKEQSEKIAEITHKRVEWLADNAADDPKANVVFEIYTILSLFDDNANRGQISLSNTDLKPTCFGMAVNYGCDVISYSDTYGLNTLTVYDFNTLVEIVYNSLCCNNDNVETQAEKIAESAQAESIVNVTAREAMREYTTNGNTDTFGRHLQTLASILAQCKLRNLYNDDKKGREEFKKFKAEVCNYRSQQMARENIDSCYVWSTDEGAYICADKLFENSIVKAMRERSDDVGAMLVQECCLHLLEVIKKAEKLTETTLLDVFTVYDLRSMYYQDGTLKPSEKWKEKATNGVKEGSLAISRLIESERAIREQTALYNEIVTHCVDEDGTDRGTFTTYKKVSTFSATDITDINGKVTATVSDEQSEVLFKSIPDRCSFSRKERYVFFHHYDKGESFGQIADKLKVSVSTVETYDRRLKDKIVKANIFPQFTAEDKGGITRESKAIRCYSADDEAKTTIAVFDSVRTAAKILNIDNSLIVKVLKGKRQTASGLKFEYIDK